MVTEPSLKFILLSLRSAVSDQQATQGQQSVIPSRRGCRLFTTPEDLHGELSSTCDQASAALQRDTPSPGI